ncbi:hypothetical protein HaLaN_27206 [Haematococcus lacustris]|uniref:Uncharacterized protein n=1 Tax=Haematococcus lacustris TaxID=44745 RepID=A0A6A0A829_HAELA|nr:hypothetical protein HaLaN_27206 [Haematococcus lacustris]
MNAALHRLTHQGGRAVHFQEPRRHGSVHQVVQAQQLQRSKVAAKASGKQPGNHRLTCLPSPSEHLRVECVAWLLPSAAWPGAAHLKGGLWRQLQLSMVSLHVLQGRRYHEGSAALDAAPQQRPGSRTCRRPAAQPGYQNRLKSTAGVSEQAQEHSREHSTSTAQSGQLRLELAMDSQAAGLRPSRVSSAQQGH